MTALPIAQRELALAARRPRTYYGRFAIVLAGSILGGFMVWSFNRMTGRAPGAEIFNVASFYLGLYFLFGGAAATADCLSAEKREGTLGLLFLTDLRAFDIIAGKLAASSLQLFYGLLAGMPVLGLLILLGGVGGRDFAWVCLVLLNALFFAVTAGVFISSLCEKQKKAMGAASFLMVFLAFILPAAGHGLAAANRWPEFAAILQLFNPVHGVALSFRPAGGAIHPSWMSLLITHGLGWIFLGLACWILPRSWQDKAAGPAPQSWKERWQTLANGNAESRRKFRSRALEQNPFYWLTSRQRYLRVDLLGLIVLCFFVWTTAWRMIPRNDPLISCLIAAVFLHTVIKGQTAFRAAQQILEDRDSGALELMLSTRLSLPEIISGQWKTLRGSVATPIAVLLAMELAVILFTLLRSTTVLPGAPEVPIALYLAGAIMLIADFLTMGWLGLWMGVSEPSLASAQKKAMQKVFILPWLIFGGFAGIVMQHSIPFGGFYGAVAAWLAVGLGCDVYYIQRARRKLMTEFREKAATRFEPEEPFWKGWMTRIWRKRPNTGWAEADS